MMEAFDVIKRGVVEPPMDTEQPQNLLKTIFYTAISFIFLFVMFFIGIFKYIFVGGLAVVTVIAGVNAINQGNLLGGMLTILIGTPVVTLLVSYLYNFLAIPLLVFFIIWVVCVLLGANIPIIWVFTSAWSVTGTIFWAVFIISLVCWAWGVFKPNNKSRKV